MLGAKRPLLMDGITVEPIWSDSMGAKSMCVRVSTRDTSFLLDPAAAEGCRIVRQTNCETILYDHHLTREKGFKEMTRGVWEAAEETGSKLLAYREYLEGREALVEVIADREV